MNLKSKTPASLIIELKSLVAEERRLTLEILHYLQEIEHRKLHLDQGFPSLFEFAVKELGYTEGSAHRRISAMRLMKDIPETRTDLESGAISLTVAAQAQSFFRAEEKQRPVSHDEKRQILKTLKNKSSREAERELAKLSPDQILPRDSLRPVSEEHTQVHFTADRALIVKLEKLKALLAHRNYSGNLATLLHLISDIAIEKLEIMPRAHTEPRKRLTESPKESSVTTSVSRLAEKESGTGRKIRVHSRYISVETRKEVWARDQGKCTYSDPSTGRTCGSRYGLQMDHRIPWSRGGSGSAQNLRLLCGAHNRRAAELLGLKRHP